MEKKKVYVETTVVSDATALPTNDIVLMGRQITTIEWWNTAADRFELFCSDVVKREAGRGDQDAARRRLSALEGKQVLLATPTALAPAQRLITTRAVPKEYPDDALHIAIATVEKMDFLVSWNFKHITNAQKIPMIKRICAECGYVCPEICTPYQLQQDGGAE